MQSDSTLRSFVHLLFCFFTGFLFCFVTNAHVDLVSNSYASLFKSHDIVLENIQMRALALLDGEEPSEKTEQENEITDAFKTKRSKNSYQGWVFGY